MKVSPSFHRFHSIRRSPKILGFSENSGIEGHLYNLYLADVPEFTESPKKELNGDRTVWKL